MALFVMVMKPAYRAREDDSTFLRDVVEGLRSKPKQLPCKYFYDARGSSLFDKICELEAYYPTRVELALLTSCVAEIAAMVGPRARVVELGSGSGNKTLVFLRHLVEPVAYIPVDISFEPLRAAAQSLARDLPSLTIVPLHADYMQPFTLPAPRAPFRRTVAYFPGSTIGNLVPADAVRFLQRIRQLVGEEGALVIGVDLKKDPVVLHDAYNDDEGVTAAFNMNLLARINRELGANFDLERFRHYACYDTHRGRIEMQLVSLEPQTVTVAGVPFSFELGEPIVTEYSYKYSLPEFARLAESAGLTVRRTWTDERRSFSVQYLAPA